MENIIIGDNIIFDVKRIILHSGVCLEITNKIENTFVVFKDNYDFYVFDDYDENIRFIIHVKNGNIIKLDKETYKILNDDKITFEKQVEHMKRIGKVLIQGLFNFLPKINIDESCTYYISSLNEILHKFCKDKNIRIEINYTYAFDNPTTYGGYQHNQLLLCLMYNDKCVSSINFEFNEGEENFLEISSLTSPAFQNKKYNKLLRSILVGVIYFLDPSRNIKFFRSTAMNAVSAYTLLQLYSDVIIRREKNQAIYKYLDSIGKDVSFIKTLSVSQIKEIYSIIERNELVIDVPINDTNFYACDYRFEEIVEKLSCE